MTCFFDLCGMELPPRSVRIFENEGEGSTYPPAHTSSQKQQINHNNEQTNTRAMTFHTLLAFFFVASIANAWMTTLTMSTGSAITSRRNVINTLATTTVTSASFFLASSPRVANAMEACPPKSQNCVRATWTPPLGTSNENVVSTLRQVLNAYPQEGLENNVDGGGWIIAMDELDSKGTARVEYRSSGKGNLAKFFNAGKPFVDDLLIEVGNNGVVELRSSSRVGESDFGVNTKVSSV